MGLKLLVPNSPLASAPHAGLTGSIAQPSSIQNLGVGRLSGFSLLPACLFLLPLEVPFRGLWGLSSCLAVGSCFGWPCLPPHLQVTPLELVTSGPLRSGVSVLCRTCSSCICKAPICPVEVCWDSWHFGCLMSLRPQFLLQPICRPSPRQPASGSSLGAPLWGI